MFHTLLLEIKPVFLFDYKNKSHLLLTEVPQSELFLFLMANLGESINTFHYNKSR